MSRRQLHRCREPATQSGPPARDPGGAWPVAKQRAPPARGSPRNSARQLDLFRAERLSHVVDRWHAFDLEQQTTEKQQASIGRRPEWSLGWRRSPASSSPRRNSGALAGASVYSLRLNGGSPLSRGPVERADLWLANIVRWLVGD